MKTYNVVLNDNENSNDLGLKCSINECINYIELKRSDYFKDYAGGTATIICNETGDEVLNYEIELTADFIKEKGILIDTNPDLQSELYFYKGNEYVILSENTVITREIKKLNTIKK